MNNQVDFIGIYDFNENSLLVEMLIDEYADQIDINSFCVPNILLDKSSWQVAYMEQYLNREGTSKICETYRMPTSQAKPSRITFFVFKTDDLVLSTSYGEFSLANPQVLPDRLAKIIEFEDSD